MAVEPRLSDFVEELVVEIFFLSPDVKASSEGSQRSVSSNLGKGGLSEVNSSTIIFHFVLDPIYFFFELLLWSLFNNGAVVVEPFGKMSLFILNVVLSNVRIIVSLVKFVDFELFHGSGGESVALTPKLAVFILELSTNPFFGWFGDWNLIKGSTALILEFGEVGVLGSNSNCCNS